MSLDIGAAYTYRVSAAASVTINGQGLLQRKIVATGNVQGVSRRVVAVAASATGTSLFGSYSVISLSDLTMQTSTRIAGSASSNGNISLSNSAELCGDLVYGAGKRFTTANSSRRSRAFSAGRFGGRSCSTPSTAARPLSMTTQESVYRIRW